MEKKRLVGIVCLLLGAMFSIAVVADKYPSLEEDSVANFKDNKLNLNYAYAIGVGVDDDDDCQEGEDASNYPETMQIYQKISEGNVILDVYGHQGETLYDTNQGEDYCFLQQSCPFETCKWQLPLSSPKEGGGCYLLANEHDSGKGTIYSNAPDDCTGWIMPIETTLPSPGQTTPKATGKEILETNGGSFTEDSFPKYFTETANLLRGTWDPVGDSPASSEAACMMSKLFPSNTKSFLCMNATEKEKFVWYICDNAHTGEFIKSNDGMNAFFCKADSGPPKWVKEPLDCESLKKLGIDCDDAKGKEICTSKYGTPLDDAENPGSAWNEQVGCCGDDGLNDLGKISDNQMYLCFNELITPESIEYGENTGKTMFQVYSEIISNYNDGWRWISASEDAGIFKIKTRVDTNQDILSNGAYWYYCNETTFGPLKKDGIESTGDVGKAGRFFCLGYGAFGFWKECITEEEQKQFNDYSRQILLGENVFTLYPHTQDSTTISSEGQFLSSGVPIQYEKKASPKSPPMLKIIFSFTEDPYFKLATENLEPKVTFSGLSQEDSSMIEDNLFNDHLSVPYLEKDVPLTADVYYPVKEPTISSVIPAQIKKVYITTDDSLFCSGKEEFEEGKSSWIADLDDSPKLPGDKTACESNGYTWTGTRCCGDDISSGLDDFYANDGFVTGLDEEGNQILDLEKPRGCWAGIPLKDGEAVGQIKFTISAEDKILDELYPCKKEAEKECRYFIKGIINSKNKIIEKVKLSNSYPEKYDLTAKLYNKAAHQDLPFEIKITAKEVEIDRTKYYLEAKNVPAMAIVGKDEEGNGKFFTCGADLISMGAGMESKIKEMPLCAISGANYCSAQGWTDKAPNKFNFNLETKEYEPTEEAYEPAIFDHSSSIVFGRNLIPNANFMLNDQGNLDKWQKASQGTLKVEKEKLLFQGELISPPMYLEKDSYIISFTSNCDSNDYFDVYLSDNPATNDVKGPTVNPFPKEYTTHGDWGYNYEYSVESGKYWLKLLSNEKECSIGEFTLYRNQGTLTPFNYDALHQPMTAQQCCPENSCWNGFTCVGDMSEQTEREETVADGVSYRCLKGNWTVQEKKWDWAHKVQGYCEKESQCFVAPITPTGDAQGATAGVAAEEFYKETTPSCINDTEFIFDHYCKEGEWTTRTKFLIESLQSLAKKNDYPKYTLYCSPYTETLNEYGSSVYDVEQFIGGGQDYTKTSTDKGCQFKKDDPACQTTGKLCFSEANSNLVPNEENTCVNNFCLLTHEEDNQQKTIFAVSLNRPIDDTSFSFLRSLGIDNSEEIKSYCQKEGDDWVDCQNKVGFLKYHPKLNLAAYSSEEFEFEPGALAKLLTGVKDAVEGAIDFIGGLFGLEVDKVEPGQLPEPLKDKLITTAFTACPGIDTSRYFSFFGEGKSAVACVWNNTLSASYYNFVTPICDYTSHTLKEKQWWLTEEPHEGKELPLPGEPSLFCDSQSKNLIIKDPNDIAFWWPQLTGRLRIN